MTAAIAERKKQARGECCHRVLGAECFLQIPKAVSKRPLLSTPLNISGPSVATIPDAVTAPGGPTSPRWLLLLLWLGLGAILLLAYANSFHAALVLDNKIIIGNDPRLRA